MRVVLKKISSIFKSKFVLVPLIAIGLVGLGAGIAAVTNRDPAVAKSTSSRPTQAESSYFGKRGSSLSSNNSTLGESTTTESSTSSSESTTPVSQPVKPKSTTKTSTKTQSPKSTNTTPPPCDKTDPNSPCYVPPTPPVDPTPPSP